MNLIGWIITWAVVFLVILSAWVWVKLEKLLAGKLTLQDLNFWCVIGILMFSGPLIEWWLS